MTEKFIHFTQLFSRGSESDEDNILVKLEKVFLISLRDNDSIEKYNNFDEQIKTYLSKISGHSKDVCQQLLDREVLYVGVNTKKINSILGASIFSQSNKLMACIAELSMFDISIDDYSIGNIDELINQYYYQFIRVIIKTNVDTLMKNFNLHNLVIQYYTFLLLKVLKIPSMVDKKIELLKYLVGILYYKHFLKMNPFLAKEKSLELVSANLKDEIDKSLPDVYITKYDNIKDIVKLMIDVKIVFDTPNNLTYHMLNNLKVVSFLSITSTFDHLIAAIICSLTSLEYYKPLFINKQIQEQIEKQLTPYYSKVSYEPISKFTVQSLKKDEK